MTGRSSTTRFNTLDSTQSIYLGSCARIISGRQTSWKTLCSARTLLVVKLDPSSGLMERISLLTNIPPQFKTLLQEATWYSPHITRMELVGTLRTDMKGKCFTGKRKTGSNKELRTCASSFTNCRT